MLRTARHESYFSFNQVIAMKNFMIRNLLNNADLIVTIFDKNINEVMSKIETLTGTEEEMLAQFFVELNIPLNQHNYKIISAIANRHMVV